MSPEVRDLLINLVRAHRHQTDEDRKGLEFGGIARQYLKPVFQKRITLCGKALAELGAK